jgi:hypothetical protein
VDAVFFFFLYIKSQCIIQSPNMIASYERIPQSGENSLRQTKRTSYDLSFFFLVKSILLRSCSVGWD